ncbi:hypothetical protein RHSIM_Rhsim12G0009000 [Rhododendron simsii]|uniref:RRM domain-containing protein n=1 Tax=Rhododendron simsii TaxID=118357 RepID=A0A834G4G2_RHOSS|nr:hypothetical protein RHSIM_Rhsim12G0009000 [Rhododendron simsii]
MGTLIACLGIRTMLKGYFIVIKRKDLKLSLCHGFNESETDYAAFEERVRRTVYVDNLSPQVNESILKSAFDQFGNVCKVEFIPNYAEESNMPRYALVEMDSPENQLEEEENIAKQQAETLEANYKKYELIEKVLKDGTTKKLGHRYGINEFNA